MTTSGAIWGLPEPAKRSRYLTAWIRHRRNAATAVISVKGKSLSPNRITKWYEAGRVLPVLDTGPGNKLTVESSSGEQIAFSPRTHTKLSVYQAVSAELAPGDKVMVTRNDKTLDVANGDRFTVKTVEGEKLTLEDKKGARLSWTKTGFIFPMLMQPPSTNPRAYL
nr:hypothetical protein [Escherichia coli]